MPFVVTNIQCKSGNCKHLSVFIFVSVLQGCHADVLFEETAKVGGVVHAATQGDVGDGHVGGVQQLAGIGQADEQDVLGGGIACDGFELAVELCPQHA